MPVAVPSFPLHLIETETEVVCADRNGELWARLNASDRNRGRLEIVYRGLCLYFAQTVGEIRWLTAEEFDSVKPR